MGSIERRIEALERSFGNKAAEKISETKARLIEELRAHLPEAEEKVTREEAEGNFARRRVLEDLEESVKRRIRAREDGI